MKDNILTPILLTITDVDVTNLQLLTLEPPGNNRVSSSLTKNDFDLVHNVKSEESGF